MLFFAFEFPIPLGGGGVTGEETGEGTGEGRNQFSSFLRVKEIISSEW
jgi:hypothetical protein